MIDLGTTQRVVTLPQSMCAHITALVTKTHKRGAVYKTGLLRIDRELFDEVLEFPFGEKDKYIYRWELVDKGSTYYLLSAIILNGENILERYERGA